MRVRCADGRARRPASPASPGCGGRACTATKSRVCREERLGHRFVLLRLARAGRVDQPSARRDHAGGVLRASPAARPRAPAGRPRAAATGCPDRAAACRDPSRAHRRARSRKRDAERQRPRQVGLHEPDVRARRWQRRCAAAASCAGRGRRTRRAGRRRPSAPRSPSSCRRARRRCRARAAPGDRPASSATSCDASSCTTNQPASGPSPRSGCPSSTIERVGGEAAGVHGDVVARASRREQLVAACAQAVGAQRQRRRLVVEPHPRFGARRSRSGRASARRASADATA